MPFSPSTFTFFGVTLRPPIGRSPDSLALARFISIASTLRFSSPCSHSLGPSRRRLRSHKESCCTLTDPSSSAARHPPCDRRVGIGDVMLFLDFSDIPLVRARRSG